MRRSQEAVDEGSLDNGVLPFQGSGRRLAEQGCQKAQGNGNAKHALIGDWGWRRDELGFGAAPQRLLYRLGIAEQKAAAEIKLMAMRIGSEV